MKPYQGSAFVVALLLFFNGCYVRSILPLLPEDEYVAVPGIVGTWGTEEDTWVFTNSPESRTYTLFHTYEEQTSEFLVAFGLIGGELYLDLSPVEPDTESQVLKRHTVLGHTFHKVELASSSFRLGSTDDAWFQDKITSGEVSIEHFEAGGLIILSADTKALQALVREHSDEMFSEITTVRKRTL